MAFKSEKSFPFDSELIEGEYDRSYVADDFARYFRAFISSGMFMKKPDNLQVIANGDMTVTLKPGKIIIDGYRYDNLTDLVIPLSPADGLLSRIDRISLTWDRSARCIHMVKQEGELSYRPVAPECRRNAEYLDYVSADIKVSAGAVSISQADITDQRLNTEVCGLAIPFVEIDTANLYQQIQSDLLQFKNGSQAEFNTWSQNFISAMNQYKTTIEEECDEWYQQQQTEMETFQTKSERDWNEWFNAIKAQLNSNQIGNLQTQINSNNVAKLNGSQYATLKEFVIATNRDNLYPNLFRFKDTGGWGPKGSNWYRCMVIYQNPYNNPDFDIDGNALFLTSTNELYLGHITGTQSANNLAITYKRVMLNADFLDTLSGIKANTATGKGVGALAFKAFMNQINRDYYGTGGYPIPFDLMPEGETGTNLERLGSFYVSDISQQEKYHAPDLGYVFAFGESVRRYAILFISTSSKIYFRTNFSNWIKLYPAEGVVLWENPWKTGDIVSSTYNISCDLGSYKEVEIIFCEEGGKPTENIRTTGRLPFSGTDLTAELMCISQSYSELLVRRGRISTEGIMFEESKRYALSGSLSTALKIVCVPLKVIGY